MENRAEVDLPASSGAGGLTLCNLFHERSGGARFEIVVRSRGFEGRLQYALEPEELSSLVSDLKQMYDTCAGATDMRLHQEETHISFQMDTRGRLFVTGVLIQYEHPQQRFDFRVLLRPVVPSRLHRGPRLQVAELS